MKIIYGIDYQYLRKGASRPDDDGVAVDVSSQDNPLILLPAVGDYVDISGQGEEYTEFSGKVKSKLFRYIRTSSGLVHCTINIVVEESNDDWGKLIKE
ncbi:hypothetical protein OX886_23620 [Serratia marcescens]|uniref:hypothetical protein n=1 Tax=Serratia marcescens TaxID=615 RepID=UPI0009A4F315|nr:hypothetical protein [Serratia marcescens]OPJ97325.1 hypothetical protein B1H39_02110 [Serratia marcescens]